MVQGITVRAAAPEDGEAVARMAADLSTHEGMPPPAFTAATFRAAAFGPDAAVAAIVAEKEGWLVGYALHYGGYDVQTGSRGRHVADLYVVPEHRRQGIGRALLASVARAGKVAGAAWLILQVRRSNSVGDGFYRAVGGQADEDRTYLFHGPVFQDLAAFQDRAARPG